PYDRIMVTAAAEKVPQALLNQLAKNGKMVIPVGSGFIQDLLFIKKDPEGEIEIEALDNVRFVKLVTDI
ncbi:MAG: protein-L-isoaspartate(D-aspartate) O-methyltransferase, partial [Clostridium sp.]|nr:protein-L-isoaspartate(D-aspartate) O-methyltransferase [Clostridium sp.]